MLLKFRVFVIGFLKLSINESIREKYLKTKSAMVIFQPSGRRGQVPLGVSIVEASRLLGVDIEAPCGTTQVCGKCKIRIEEGVFQKLGLESKQEHAGSWQAGEEKYISVDEKKAGFRMGCVATVEGDLLIFVPEAARAGKQVVSKAPRHLDITLNPAVKQYHVQLEPPTLEDPIGNFERLCVALGNCHNLKSLTIDLSVLRSLQNTLEAGEWQATVSIWMDREIILVQPGKGATHFRHGHRHRHHHGGCLFMRSYFRGSDRHPLHDEPPGQIWRRCGIPDLLSHGKPRWPEADEHGSC